jgi:hypothetical protein
LTDDIKRGSGGILPKSTLNSIFEKLKLEKGEDYHTGRKIIASIIVMWLPMLILSLIENTAINPSLRIDFLHDYIGYARFFVAIPVLFFTDRLGKYQTKHTVKYFLNSGIISDNNIEQDIQVAGFKGSKFCGSDCFVCCCYAF